MPLAEPASGRFEVLSRIAAGGMGEVYRARMSSGGGAVKQVALKVVLDEHADDPHFAELLIAEARVAMSLSHANVVQAFDAGRLGQRFYLAMELVDGATVRELLRRHGAPLPIAQAVTVAVEALKGLDYAHRFRDPDSGQPLDIVHRDVSPSNLLVSREGEVKVADFGIAQSTLAEEEEGTVRGKFAYMSPEHLRAEALDLRSDIYALGVVLYEMLTATRPFGRSTSPEMLAAIDAGSFEPPTAHRPDLHPDLERITLRAMSRRREDRYPSAAALRQDLERWALDAGVLLSTSDLADLVRDLPERSGVRPNASAPAPTLKEGTVLTRSRVDDDGVSVLLPAFDAPSLDLGAELGRALGTDAPATAATADVGPVAPPPAVAAGGRPTTGRSPLALLGVGAALLLGAGAAVFYVAQEDGPVAADDSAITHSPGADLEAPRELPRGVDPPIDAPTPAAPRDPREGDDAPPGRPDVRAPEPTATESATRPARRRAAAPEPAAGAAARIWIASDPWATVTMDGRPLGRTTLNGREVPAGRHRFVLRNEPAGLTHGFTATLAPGEERRFSIDLRDP